MPALRSANMKLVSFEVGKLPKNVREQYIKVSNIVRLIEHSFPGVFTFRLIDSSSMLGLWKTLRHRIRKTPCLLYKGRKIAEGLKDERGIIAAIKKIL